MLLCIDISNADISVGLLRQEKVVAHWRLESHGGRTSDEYSLQLHLLLAQQRIAAQEIDGMVLASVVPALTPVWTALGERLLGKSPLVVGAGIKTGLQIRREAPRQLGADRVANAVAARALHPCPLVVVDFGSTTTFDVLGTDGAYLGHVIAPGLAMSAAALSRDTAQLPVAVLQRPPRVIGRNTIESIQSGLVFGFVGLVEGVVSRLQAEQETPMQVIATGPQAQLIVAETDVFDALEPWLTLTGLRLIWEMNAPV
ncbi:MAG: type III pantothenate kinase [Chloroflexi bacterium]|nr:type III pantothenate kinase [Chloroflexota bacterium]